MNIIKELPIKGGTHICTWLKFGMEVPHIGTIIIRVSNIALPSHGMQATPLLKLHKSKDQEKMAEGERLQAELVMEKG